MAHDFCWICAGEFAQPFPIVRDLTQVDCKTCGEYTITGSLKASRFPLPDSERFRFSYWCKQRQLEGRPPPPLSSHTIDGILAQLPNPPTHTKPDLLLRSLTLLHPEPGAGFKIDGYREKSLACAREERDLEFFLDALQKAELIEVRSGREFRILHAGWMRAAELANQPAASKTAFVAMKFNADMLALWPTTFAPAIERARFVPRLANDPQHNDQIDAHIIAELKQSRFVIADVTFGAQGVYFEAGYALGLGRSVIWTCRSDRKTDMHFDTRQYNHILWDTPEQLREELYYRIVATI